jgi:hypothetical protein
MAPKPKNDTDPNQNSQGGYTFNYGTNPPPMPNIPNPSANNQGGYTFNYDPNAPVAPQNQGPSSSSNFSDANKKSEYDKWTASFGDDYIGKEKKAEWEANWNARKSNEQRQGAYQSGGSGFTVSGTPQEQAGFLGGLELANTGYGQNIFQTGQDINEIRQTFMDKMRGSANDPMIAALQNQKANAVASTQRNLASQGMKGGVAANVAGDVGRKQDAQTAAGMSALARQSAIDAKGIAGNTLAGTLALAQSGKGEQTQFPGNPNLTSWTDMASNSVICTELFKQGIMPLDIYAKDVVYGRSVYSNAPHIIIGYHFWAKPVVRVMKKSKLFTKIVAYPAMKWANQMAGKEKTIIGFLSTTVGEYICGVIGKIIILGEKYDVRKLNF